MQPPGRERQPAGMVSPDRQFCQQILDRDQPGDVRPDRLTQLAGGPEHELVTFGATRLEHGREVAVQGAVRERDLDHAPDPGGVESHLLAPRISSGRGSRRMDVLIPKTAKTPQVVGLIAQAAWALSW